MKEKDLDINLDNLIIDGLIKEAEQENADFEYALKNISNEEFFSIIGSTKQKPTLFKKNIRERLMWIASVAAVAIIAVTVGWHMTEVSRLDGIQAGKCDILYAYNVSEIPDLSVGVRGDKMIDVPDIKVLSEEKLKEVLPNLANQFKETDDLQEINIYGRILVVGYLRLHEVSNVKDVIRNMKGRLSSEAEDYVETLNWCEQILSQLQ